MLTTDNWQCWVSLVSDRMEREKEGLKLLYQLIFFFFVIPFYLQSLLVHSANCVKTCIHWHVEECSVALLCN
jgi:hypothetical protein